MKANQYIGQFLETLDNLDKNGQHVPGMIVSSPGFGKTSTIEKWCKYHDYNLTTLIASNFSADDILGLQAVNNGELKRLTPSWFNDMQILSKNKKRNVLFLDEIGACDAYIQSPLFNLIFNRDLAGASLPDNTLIVAASNYAEDLNNSFKMTAPLVNRFMILNLKPEDFSLLDILDGGITELKNKKEIEEFIGLTSSKEKKYNFDLFKDWIRDNKTEFKFGKSEFTEDISLGGLLGFTSLRSFSYSLQFAEAFMNTFNSSIWMRIVGDTLGMSVKRENKPMRMVLECNECNFVSKSGVSSKISTIYDACKEILNGGDLDKTIADLEVLISSANSDNITSADLEAFAQVCAKYSTNKKMSYLNSLMTSKFVG